MSGHRGHLHVVAGRTPDVPDERDDPVHIHHHLPVPALRDRTSACDTQHAGLGCAHVERRGPPDRAVATSDGGHHGDRCSRWTGRLTILELLARDGEAGVTEIAAELGVHKSTAFRLLATLEAHRLVEQDSDRGRYRLGVGNLRLAGATTARLDLVQEARPVCRQLAADTGETVNIAVRAETSALYLDQVAGSSALQSHNWVGQHIPLHATSNGKVLRQRADDATLKRASASCRATPPRRSPPRQAPRRAGRGAQAGVRRRGRRARDRSDRRRGTHPQRPRRHDRVDERLGPELPARRRTPRATRCPASGPRPSRSRTAWAGANASNTFVTLLLCPHP